MKIKEIRDTDKESLNAKLLELKKELVKINAQVAIGTTPKNPGQVKAMKKTIARILTVLKEKPEILETNAKSRDKESSKPKEKEVEKKA